MEDVTAKVQPTHKDLDEWIEQLFECKQLSESQVKIVCDKVSIYVAFFVYLLTYSISRFLLLKIFQVETFGFY